MEQKHIDLIRRLIQSTKNKKIEWQKSSAKWQYRLELNAATFVLDRIYDYDDPYNQSPENTITCYSLNMYNGDNTEIRIAYVTDADFTSDYQLMEELYQEAEESCIRENETINKVIDELDKLDLPYY